MIDFACGKYTYVEVERGLTIRLNWLWMQAKISNERDLLKLNYFFENIYELTYTYIYIFRLEFSINGNVNRDYDKCITFVDILLL